MYYVKHMNRRRIMGAVLIGTMSISLMACGKNTNLKTASNVVTVTESQASSSIVGLTGQYVAASIDTSKMFTARDSEIGYDPAASVTVNNISGGTYKISSEGTYIFTGDLKGQILVEAGSEDKVQIVLSNANITNESSAAIYVKNADKVFITVTGNNTVSTTSEFVAIDDNKIDAAIFAKDTVTFNGDGKLSVSCKYGNAIVSKDDLKITCGTYVLEAGSDGIQGKDSVRISGGDITITAGDDGIQSNNDEDAEKGYIYISGGSLNIKAGSAKGDSSKGIKAEKDIVIDGGTITVDSIDDSIHANNSLTVNDGKITVSSSDDGIHAEAVLIINGGDVTVKKSYEGLEAEIVNITGGNVDITASDDGINAAGGNDQGNSQGDNRDNMQKGQFPMMPDDQMPDMQDGQFPMMPDDQMPDMQDGQFPMMPDGQMPDMQNRQGKGGKQNFDGNGNNDGNQNFGGRQNFDGNQNFGGNQGRGGMMFDTDENAVICIDGGNVTVNAGGDGLDSNGYIYINGGDVKVYGPTDNGNAAVDFGIAAVSKGGTLVALGSSGMAEAFDASSTQCTMLVNLNSTISKGTEVVLEDLAGNTIISITAQKNCNSVCITSPLIKKGETYTLKAGSESVNVTMESTIYSNRAGNQMNQKR